ncbi:hypothetical protein ACQ4PT_007879 [Festuca glaucescens]
MRTSLLLLLIVGATVLYTIATPAAALDGEWRPIKNIAVPHVQKLSKWAVVEHMKVSNCGLKFNKVVSAEVKILDGKNYRLHIDVLRPDDKHVVHATEVFEHS